VKWLILAMMWLAGAGGVAAREEEKYAVIVNPVRARQFWADKSLAPIENHYKAISQKQLKATWLLQDEVLADGELVELIEAFDKGQEIGIFLEITEKTAKKARVAYEINRPWYDPGVVFLSGYSRRQRKKLIDTIWEDFRGRFGNWPKAVGAWWIDSYSLEYIKQKYGVKTVLIVADQKTTDGYGVWGQWWGVPYWPAKTNMLRPARDREDWLGITTIQWAQRDLGLAYGEGEASLFSLQANDYTKTGQDINYFKRLAGDYWQGSGGLKQITVGLEVGMESVGMEKEWEKQLDFLVEEEAKAITMSEFGEIMNNAYQDKIKVRVGNWQMWEGGRENKKLGEKLIYGKQVFSDYWVADKSSFLDRVMDSEEKEERRYVPYWLIVVIGWMALGTWKKEWREGIGWGLMWTGLNYGLILRSRQELGWMVYYGPTIENLDLVQAGLVIVGGTMGIVWRKKGWLKTASALTVINLLVWTVRVSKLDDNYYLGILVDELRFAGVWAGKGGAGLINKDLAGYVATSLLRLPLVKLVMKKPLAAILWPLVGLAGAAVISKTARKVPEKIRRWGWRIGAAGAAGWGWLMMIAEARVVN